MKELGVLAVTYRHAPTETRAKLVERDKSADSPTRALMSAGHSSGVVRAETCSRVEWIIAADNAEWALQLLEAAFVARGDIAVGVAHAYLRDEALLHVLSMSAGMDSVAEGEAAVSRQVLQSFEHAQADGTLDHTLGLLWRQIGKLVHDKRQALPARPTFGVEQLVVRRLSDLERSAPIAVIGMGDIGRAVFGRLKANQFAHVGTFGRKTKGAFDQAAATAAAVIATSASPEPWIKLPKRADSPLCVDLGSPRQIDSAEGWDYLGLDILLASPERCLSDEERNRLLALIADHVRDLGAQIHAPARAETLAALQAHKTELLQEHLPAVLSTIEDREVAKRVQRALAAAVHASFRKNRTADGGEP